MESNQVLEVIRKLVGNIKPVGDASIDPERFKNLESLCYIVGFLVSDIEEVVYDNKDRYESSVRKNADYANEFLTEGLGIK